VHMTYGSRAISRFCFALKFERSPKMGFGGDLEDRGKDIWWESTSVLRIARFQTSLIQI